MGVLAFSRICETLECLSYLFFTNDAPSQFDHYCIVDMFPDSRDVVHKRNVSRLLKPLCKVF